jgi:hypothetical protein
MQALAFVVERDQCAEASDVGPKIWVPDAGPFTTAYGRHRACPLYCISGFHGVAETQPRTPLSKPCGRPRSLPWYSRASDDMHQQISAANNQTREHTMAVGDDIATERQRLAERLARIDAERQKLADQVAELDAAERVLSRMTPGRTGARRGR